MSLDIKYLSFFLITLLTTGGFYYQQNNSQDPDSQSFQDWQKKHNKKYGSYEQEHRFSVYKENLRFIEAHNLNANYQLGENNFMDLTYDEFSIMNTGALLMGRGPPTYLTNEPLESIDWRDQDAVTPVKHQGQCGSCYAFAVVGSIESLYAIKNNKQVDLAEQALVDCGDLDTFKCNGGWPTGAMKWVAEQGLPLEEEYEYKGFSGTCHLFDSFVKIKGSADVPRQDTRAMEQAVSLNPVTVVISATPTFQFYKGGILDSSCDGVLNHVVLVVGYGRDSLSNYDYWIVKNSWGTGWGEDGFARILKTDDGTSGICQVLDQPVYPVM